MGDIVVGLLLIGPSDPHDAEFFGVMEALAKHVPPDRSSFERVRMMTITDGGAPTLRQRARISTFLSGRQMKVCVVSSAYDNPIKRGITTAVQWINPGLGFFRPTEVRQAAAHIGLSDQLTQIWREYQSLEKRLGSLRVMRLVDATLTAERGGHGA